MEKKTSKKSHSVEARVITEQWRRYYNTIRHHSSLKYRSPAPKTLILSQVANA